MQGKDYCNIITHNAKHVTSPSEFRRCCAGNLLRDIGGIFIYLCDVSKNTKGMSYDWVYFCLKNWKTSRFTPKGCDIWKYMEILPYAVQKPDNNCRLNEFLNLSGFLLDIWKSHKINCHSHCTVPKNMLEIVR